MVTLSRQHVHANNSAEPISQRRRVGQAARLLSALVGFIRPANLVVVAMSGVGSEPPVAGTPTGRRAGTGRWGR
jgi:hypothetical protein